MPGRSSEYSKRKVAELIRVSQPLLHILGIAEHTIAENAEASCL